MSVRSAVVLTTLAALFTPAQASEMHRAANEGVPLTLSIDELDDGAVWWHINRNVFEVDLANSDVQTEVGILDSTTPMSMMYSMWLAFGFLEDATDGAVLHRFAGVADVAGNWVRDGRFVVSAIDTEASNLGVSGFGMGLPLFENVGTPDVFISECDVSFSPKGVAGWDLVALTHEFGHCLGFNHSFLSSNLLSSLAPLPGRASFMSYDYPSYATLFEDLALPPTDQILARRHYADSGSSLTQTLSGRVVACDTGQPISGALVIALEHDPLTSGVRPVHLRVSDFSEPTLAGGFELDGLDANRTHSILAVSIDDPALDLRRTTLTGERVDGRPFLWIYETASFEPGVSLLPDPFKEAGRWDAGAELPSFARGVVGQIEPAEPAGSVQVCVGFEP